MRLTENQALQRLRAGDIMGTRWPAAVLTGVRWGIRMGVYVKVKPDTPIQGPFTRNQLKGLAASGQLKAHYLLSNDMKTWYPVENVRGLLGGEDPLAAAAAATAPPADAAPQALEPRAAPAARPRPVPVAREVPPTTGQPAPAPAGESPDLMAALKARPLLLALVAAAAGALVVLVIVLACLLLFGGNGEGGPPPVPAVKPPAGTPTTTPPPATTPPATTPPATTPPTTTPPATAPAVTPPAVTPPATPTPPATTPPAATPPPATPATPVTPPATPPPATTPTAPATPSGPVVVPPPREAPTPPPPSPNTKAEPPTKPQAYQVITATYGGQEVQAMGSRLSFNLTNRTGLDIQSAKGQIRLYDPAGGYLAGLPTEIDEPVKPGGTVLKEGVWMEVGGMILGMLNTSSKQMKFKFAAEEITYTNGRTVSFK